MGGVAHYYGELLDASSIEVALQLVTKEVESDFDCIEAWVGEVTDIHVIDVAAIKAIVGEREEARRKVEQEQHERDTFNRLRRERPEWFAELAKE